jgi:hypothetical protein
VLPSVRKSLWAIPSFAAVAACNAILGLGDPIDGGGPLLDASEALAEGAFDMDGAAGDGAAGNDGTLPDLGTGGPDSADAGPNPIDAQSPPDAATTPDAGTALDAATQDAVDPCEGLPDASSCGCRSNVDCVEAGGCCCFYPGVYTLCDSRHNCPIYDNGSCLPF